MDGSHEASVQLDSEASPQGNMEGYEEGMEGQYASNYVDGEEEEHAYDVRYDHDIV